MAWWDKIDPLKGVDLFGTRSKGSNVGDGLRTGWSIYTTVAKTVAGRHARKKMEQDEARERQRIKDAIANPPTLHGSARWATAGELQRAGVLRDGDAAFDHPSSLLLGAFADPAMDGAIAGQVHWDGEGHLITIAPTRTGKSTTTIVPNLVRYRGSCVVLDPKGELYRDTAAWRRSMGQSVYRIAPFAGGNDGFNPMDEAKTFAGARELASLLMPYDPKAVDFFRKDAVGFLTAVILYVNEYAPEGNRTLQEVRNIVSGPVDEMIEVANEMLKMRNPAYVNAAGAVMSKGREAMGTLRSTFASELSIWDDPQIAGAVAGTFDFGTLKDRPVTVYIEVPFNKMEAYGPFLKVVLTSALDAMLRNERHPKIPVLFILDEFLSLGAFPQFVDAIRTHAGSGVRLWFFLQNLAELEKLYRDSWRTFLDAAVKMFFGTKDGHTGRLISEHILGTTTLAHFSGGLSKSGKASTGDIFDRDSSVNTTITAGVAYSARPLLTATEVVARLSGKFDDHTRNGIIAIDDVAHPIDLRMVPYFRSKKCSSRVPPRPRPAD